MFPRNRLTNDDLSKLVETDDEWITTRTGIKERRIAADDEYTSDMARESGPARMEQAGITGEEMQLSSWSRRHSRHGFSGNRLLCPNQDRRQTRSRLDISAACAGFLFAVEIGQQFITSHTYDTVLVIGAEKLTTITDWTERNTCVLFGRRRGRCDPPSSR